MSKAKTWNASGAREYLYTQEIPQMMFVSGEVQDPNIAAVNLVEDIVRSQVLEIVIQARQLALKRGARYISPEDLIFIIRHDRAKVNSLRTYMSWKEVRKNAKDTGDGKPEIDEAAVIEEGAEEQNVAKPKKRIIKLPWDITSIYSESLNVVRTNHPNIHAGHSDDEDEDEQEAHEDSLKRLREADQITRNMTKEEYMQFSECRQASFTWRKGKRFKEFLNLPSQLDLRSDDTIDILGFLAYEMVRSLTIGALEVKRQYEEAASTSTTATSDSPNSNNKRKLLPASADDPSSAAKRLRGEEAAEDDLPWGGAPMPVSTLFLSAPEARTPLLPQHIQDAFARMQRKAGHSKGAGLRNWQGGLRRTRISLI